MFCLLMPSNCPWGACSEFTNVTFVCFAFVHCLKVDFKVCFLYSPVFTSVTLIFHSLMLTPFVMNLQFVHYFAFKRTLVTCVFDAIMFFHLVLFCLLFAFGSVTTFIALDYMVAVEALHMASQPCSRAEIALAMVTNK